MSIDLGAAGAEAAIILVAVETCQGERGPAEMQRERDHGRTDPQPPRRPLSGVEIAHRLPRHGFATSAGAGCPGARSSATSLILV